MLLTGLFAANTFGQASTEPAKRPAAHAAEVVSNPPEARVVHPMELQIALERAGFSPGLIDGKPGAKTVAALRQWSVTTGNIDPAATHGLTVEQLPGLDIPDGPTTRYIVRTDDLQSVTGPPLTDWNEKARLPRLGYFTLGDALAEKFHTKVDTLIALNPGVSIDNISAGTSIVVPNVSELPPFPRPAKLLVNLENKQIRLLDESGKTIGLINCSIAKDKEKRPSGSATVISSATNPNYTFDPAVWPDVHNVTRKLTINPGPRNPVGMAWVGLSLPGYGMHGTPRPADIGKTGSHGCFRLANWDAIRLAKAIRIGLTVEFE